MPESPAFSQARLRAGSLAEAGNLDGARALLERAVEIGRERLVEGDTELLATMRQLAGVHVLADDPMSARRLLEEALEVGRRLSDTDPLAVLLAYDLAVVAEELANRHVARTNFARVAEFGPAALGAGHPAVVRARAYAETNAPSPAPSPAAVTPAVVPAPAPSALVPAPPSAVPAPGFVAEPGEVQKPVQAPVAPIPTALPLVPPPAPVAEPGSRSRRSWAMAAVAVVAVTVAVTAIFTRSADKAESVVSVQAAPADLALHDAGSSVMLLWGRPGNDSVVSFAITGGPVGEAPRPWGEAGPDAGTFEVKGLDPGADYCFAVVARYGTAGAATSPQSCTARAAASSAPAAPGAPSAPVTASAAPSRTPATTPTTRPATGSKTPRPASPTTGPATTVRSRIVSPAGNSTVSWPFDATFTVSPADASATGTVLSLSICVAGRCYLDGKVDLYDGVAAPYTVHLGSTRPEGTGVAWQVRLDRISKATYGTLVAERDAAIAAGTWGDTSTRMNALNATPVSTLTVTKGA